MKKPDPISPPNNTLRSSRTLSFEGIQWWQGYHRTEGLDAFRSDERYSVWLHTHRRLVRSDANYAADTRWFPVCLLWNAVVASGVGIYLSAPLLASLFCLACGTIQFGREQRRRNLRIADQLKVLA